jgi:hypothetical protein
MGPDVIGHERARAGVWHAHRSCADRQAHRREHLRAIVPGGSISERAGSLRSGRSCATDFSCRRGPGKSRSPRGSNGCPTETQLVLGCEGGASAPAQAEIREATTPQSPPRRYRTRTEAVIFQSTQRKLPPCNQTPNERTPASKPCSRTTTSGSPKPQCRPSRDAGKVSRTNAPQTTRSPPPTVRPVNARYGLAEETARTVF